MLMLFVFLCLLYFLYYFFTKCAHLVYTNTLQQISGVHVLYYSYPTLVIAEQPQHASNIPPLHQNRYLIFFLQKNVYNILSTSLIPFHVFCSNVTMKIGLSLKAFHLLGGIGMKLWTIYLKNYMYWKGHKYILGTYIFI